MVTSLPCVRRRPASPASSEASADAPSGSCVIPAGCASGSLPAPSELSGDSWHWTAAAPREDETQDTGSEEEDGDRGRLPKNSERRRHLAARSALGGAERARDGRGCQCIPRKMLEMREHEPEQRHEPPSPWATRVAAHEPAQRRARTRREHRVRRRSDYPAQVQRANECRLPALQHGQPEVQKVFREDEADSDECSADDSVASIANGA